MKSINSKRCFRKIAKTIIQVVKLLNTENNKSIPKKIFLKLII
ncbi:hypothetical protein CLCAR_3379 [Clostridium carboxidivorans P7]|nr:hypothetical protein CLCAR_3379 [Clostridium carboxidivorans P7]